jgi:acetyltransferase-like isoleucine patch superfamily enzyme
MIWDIGRKARTYWRRRQLREWSSPDDLPACAIEVAEQRRRGTSIGKMVRLIGKVDGVNPHLVTIGDYSVLGYQSALLAHCPLRGPQPCKIGSFVYIGFGAIVLPGVTIGDHCLVGAGSVVTRDVPFGSVVAGNPARVLRPLSATEIEKIKQTMLERRVFGSDRNLVL